MSEKGTAYCPDGWQVYMVKPAEFGGWTKAGVRRFTALCKHVELIGNLQGEKEWKKFF